MTTAVLRELSSYFNNIDPEDPIYQKELIRPAEIKEDVKLMEQRKRVTNIMRSKLFKKNLENIFRLNHLDDDVEGECTSTLSLADISEQLLLSALPKNKIENFYQLSQKKGKICINDLYHDSNSPYEQIERSTRCKLVSVFRLIDMYGWNGGFNSTMTARPFRDREQFLVNPFGLMSHEITASSLLSLDFKGNILDFGSTVFETHETNWMIHSAIYSSQNDVRTILHLKSPDAIAVSSVDKGLLPLSVEAMVLGSIITLSKLSSLDQKSKTTSMLLADYKNYLTSLLTTKSKVLILPNNGMLVCGDSIEEAWHLLTNCQQACETQIRLGNLNMDDLYLPTKQFQDNIYNQWRTTDLGGIQRYGDSKDFHKQWRIGELEFEALMRHLDNNGYRSGYFYHQENIYHDDLSTKSQGHKPKYEVEIPPSSISVVSAAKQLDDTLPESRDESKANKLSARIKSEKWFNTPNSYKLTEESGESDNNLLYNFAGPPSDRKSAKWVSTKKYDFSAPIPQHPVTAGAYVAFSHDTSKSDIQKDKVHPQINPKELKENQRRVKDKYYHDTNTAGPISCLLDSGLSWEEARRLKNATLQKQIGPGVAADQVVTAASKAIIQRGHKALVYQDLYKPANPFENITTDELDNYHKEIDRKLNPDRYNDQSLEKTLCVKDEAPEIKITSSQSESLMTQRSLLDSEGVLRPAVSESFDRRENNYHVPVFESSRNGDIACHPFFQSDFDEDFKNLQIQDRACTSTMKVSDLGKDSSNIGSTKLSISQIESVDESQSKDSSIKRKSFRSFSFKKLSRSKSAKENPEVSEKGATLAAPGYGTITSETSGADVSHDEGDKDGKAKKKKRRFKLPSFSKKKKDKTPKN